jgi:hypothetical protein
MESRQTLDDTAFLGMVRARLASLYHDMNNPLAVASGNVQYVGELVGMGDLQGISEALSDVSKAHGQIEARLSELLELRRTIEDRLASLGSDDAG